MSALRGRRIVVTRAADQADELARALEVAGAVPVRCPTIRVAPPESWAALDETLGRLGEYGWVVFTSSNGVAAFALRLSELGLSPGELAGPRVAAVGRSTAAALRALGVEPDFVPASERSRALAETLPDVTGVRILLTRSDIADPAVADVLGGRGAAAVDDVVAYRTVLVPPAGAALGELRRGVDGITFTSPSTVRGFLRIGPEWTSLLDGVAVVTLGPATTEAARRKGMEVAAEARERRMSGLVDALRRTFASGRVDEESAG